MHVITGLPRSGSTLLCNIINQNPRFWATSTSPLPQLCSNLISIWSTSVEIKGMLSQNRAKTEERLERSLRAFCAAWHQRDDERSIIFDKSRGWSHNIISLRATYPKSKVLVCIRDLKSIFASIEKQHQRTPLLNEAADLNSKTIFDRADKMFAPQGLIGSPIVGVEDVIRRNFNVFWVKYEQLARFPNEVMRQIYQYLEEPYFSHNFTDIKNTATDPDAFYNFKFPHKGDGQVQPVDPEEWRKYLSSDLAQTIMGRFPFYNSRFNYA